MSKSDDKWDRIALRLPAVEGRRIRRAAMIAGLSVSAYVRQLLAATTLEVNIIDRRKANADH